MYNKCIIIIVILFKGTFVVLLRWLIILVKQFYNNICIKSIIKDIDRKKCINTLHFYNNYTIFNQLKLF